MTFHGQVNGFFNDLSAGGDLFQQEKIQFWYTSDKLGKTFSLGSDKHKIQITVPFDEIEKIIRREG